MFPRYVPVPRIFYIYTREKIYMFPFAYIYFYIYKHIKNEGNDGERGTRKDKIIHLDCQETGHTRSNPF